MSDSLELLNKYQGASSFDYLTNRKNNPQLDRTIYGEDLYADLSAELPELKEDSTTYQEDKLRYDQILAKKQRANALINTYLYISQYDKGGEAFRKERDDIKRELQDNYSFVTDEDINRVHSQRILDRYLKVVGDVGTLPDEVLMSKEFFEYVDDSTFAFYASMRNHKNQGFWDTVSRGANLADWNRNLTLRAEQGEINQQEYEKLSFRINSLYHDPEDSEVIASTAGVLQNMWSVARDNPMTVIGAITVATLTGGMAAPLILSAPFAGDTYQQAQGTQLINAWGEGVQDSRENILRRSRYYSIGQASLDMGFSAVGMRLFGVDKFITNMIGRAIKKSGASYIAKAVTAKGLLKDIAITAAKVVGETGMETYINEGGQGALEQMALNAELGITGDEAWEKIKENYKKNSDEAFWPSAILSMSMGSIGLAGRNIRLRRNVEQLENNAVNAIQGELGAHTPLAKNNPNANANILDKAFQSKAYFDPERAREVFKENNISDEEIPQFLKDKMEQAQNGDNVSISMGEKALIPQNIRTALAGIATYIDGAITPELLRADLDMKTLMKLREEFKEEISQAVEQRNQEIEIENRLNEKIFKASKNTNVKQNNAIARVASSFLRAISNTTGIDIEVLYKRFEPTYERLNEDNLSADKKAIDQRGTTGTFDPLTNTITLKENSDFATVMHETSHWFLNVMKGLAKNDPKIAEMMNGLIKWSGIKNSVNFLTDEEFETLNERFVAAFIQSLVEGKTNLSGLGMYKTFLTSLRNTSLFSGWNKKNATAQGQHIKRGYEQAYNDTLPDINEDFRNFVDSIFAGDVLAEIQRTDYPIDDLLQDIDSANIAPELRENLKKEIRDVAEGLEKEIADKVQSLTIKDVLLGMVKGKDMHKVISDVLNGLPEEAKKNKDLVNYLNSLLEATEKFPKIKEKYIKRLKKDKTYQTLEQVKEYKLMDYEIPSKEEREILRSKGYLAKDGMGLSIKALFNNLYDKMSVEIKEYVRIKRLPKQQAFIKFLLETPSLEERAEQLALAEISQQFTNEMARTLANLQETIAKNHKKVASATMKALNDTFGEDKQEVEQMQSEIETVAKMDVDETIYSRASSKSYLGNARKENLKTKQALIKGDTNQAMRSTRNEYYQNTKAQYIASVKLNVEKNIRSIKQFLNGSKNYLSKNYDMELLELLRMLLSQVGLAEQRSKYSFSELKEILTSTYPEFEEAINQVITNIEKKPQYKTFWQNQTVEQVQDLVQLMQDIKALARETKGYKVGSEFIDKVNAVSGLMRVLSALKDVQSSLNMEVDGKIVTATNSKKGLWEWMKDMWRTYNNATKMVEFEMKKLDGGNMGLFHKLIYTPIKMAEIQYKKALIENMNILNTEFKKIKVKSGHIECPEFVRKDTGENWCLGIGKFEGQATLEIIGILLHYGTNRDRFLQGYIQDKPNITDKNEQLYQKQKDFEKWVQRMIKDEWITEEVLNFVQTVWDINAKIAPKLQSASREIRGFPFKRLETRNFSLTMKDGKVIHMRGGYVPAIRNKEVTGDINHGEEPNFGVKDLQNEMPLINPSYLMERADVVTDEALEIDPFILVGQTTDTLRYAYVMPAVMRVYRLLETKELKDMLERKAPTLRRDVIDPWLKSVSTMSTTSPNANVLTRALGKLIQRSSMVIMTCNLNNTLQQISNLPTLLLRASPKNVIKAIYETTCNTMVWEQINKESDFMNVRLNERNDGLNEIFSSLVVNSDQFTDLNLKAKYAYKKASNFAQKHAFFMQKTFQNSLDRIGYMAAKFEALEKGMSEEEAIRYAESSVRECFSSFDIADTTALQKSHPLLKAFTMFGGYFYSMWRLCEMGISNSFRQYGISDPKRYMMACEYVIFSQLVPAIIAEGIQRAVGEGNPWDEDDDMDIYKSSYFLAPFRMSATAFPILGKIVNSGLDRVEGKQYMSSFWLSTPWMTQFDSLITAGKHLTSDADFKGRDIRAILNAVGILTGIPEFGALARPLGYGIDVNRDAVIPDSYYEFIRGSLTGTSGEKGRQTNF